jgi:hypothetical protein
MDGCRFCSGDHDDSTGAFAHDRACALRGRAVPSSGEVAAARNGGPPKRQAGLQLGGPEPAEDGDDLLGQRIEAALGT